MAHNWEALQVRVAPGRGREQWHMSYRGGRQGAGGWPSLGCELSRVGPPCHAAALWRRADIYCILVFKLQYSNNSLLLKFSPHSLSLSRLAFLCLSSSFSICLVSLSIQFLMQSIILHCIMLPHSTVFLLPYIY